MPGVRFLAALRADCWLASTDKDAKLAVLPLDSLQNEGFGLRQHALRVARGKCHRLPRLKHFCIFVFSPSCTKFAEEP